MISACLNDTGFIYIVFFLGFLQWCFAGLILPYIWSIMHGLWLLKAEKNKEADEGQLPQGDGEKNVAALDRNNDGNQRTNKDA